MNYTARLGICAAASIASHLTLARGSTHLPKRVEAPQPVVVRVQLREPAPEPEPEPPSAEAEPKKQVAHELVSRHTRKVAMAEPRNKLPPPRGLPPTERPATNNDATNVPVFGISMESTSTSGSGPSIRVGNTLQTNPREHRGETDGSVGKALGAPVQAYEVTKMPLPKGECTGHYTEEAREAGLERVAIFDLVVDEKGRARDIKVMQGLGSGLTEAAKRALQGCRFSPGERAGKPVPVRVRSFKIRFTLRENE